MNLTPSSLGMCLIIIIIITITITTLFCSSLLFEAGLYSVASASFETSVTLWLQIPSD